MRKFPSFLPPLFAAMLIAGCGSETGTNAPERSILVDPRDGKTYTLVTIDSLTWFDANLDYSGSPSSRIGVCYNEESSNCSKYGRLYTWAEAMGLPESANREAVAPATRIQGICPNGSHLPNRSEWNSLVKAANGRTRALKDSSWGGSDILHFRALPAGSHQAAGPFAAQGSATYFWTSVEHNATYGLYFYFTGSDTAVNNAVYFKTSGNSVRCVLN